MSDAPPPLLSVSGLSRSFGALKAVDHLSFDVHPGSCVGLIGANGAGKTSLMRCLASLDLPDVGSIMIDGHDAIAYPERVRSIVGWMPDAMDMWPQTTVHDYLDFVARVNGFKGKNRVETIEYWSNFCRLSDLSSRQIAKLSKGEAQRLGLARMLIGDPKLLIMDEPAAGLDPQARVQFKELMQELQAQGRTLFISSHILSELAEMCDHLIMMDKGKLIFAGAADELNRTPEGVKEGVQMRLRPLHEPEDLILYLKEQLAWFNIELSGEWVVASFAGDDAQLASSLTELMVQHPLLEFTRSMKSLEQRFISMINQKNS